MLCNTVDQSDNDYVFKIYVFADIWKSYLDASMHMLCNLSKLLSCLSYLSCHRRFINYSKRTVESSIKSHYIFQNILRECLFLVFSLLKWAYRSIKREYLNYLLFTSREQIRTLMYKIKRLALRVKLSFRKLKAIIA